MTISVDPATRIITVPLADLTLVTAATGSFGAKYTYDVNAFRLELKDWEDSVEGMELPRTHNHNTETTLSGVTYARTFEILNGYTVTFEADTPVQSVSLTGANHNIGDVQNVNGVSLVINNSAGLQTVTIVSGSGLSVDQATQLLELWRLFGLEAGNPVTITPAGVDDDDATIDINFSGDGITTTIMERQP